MQEAVGGNTIATVDMTEATGEVLPRFGVGNERDHHAEGAQAKGIRGWLFPRH